MEYKLSHAVWEITYACNMNCMHCGSSCGEKYPDELTNEEALALCDDLVGLGLKQITLSGGEPFMRPDWSDLAKRFSTQGVAANVISNGWFITEELIDKAFESGLRNIGMSVDGLKETHDTIRKSGSFDRLMKAMDLCKERKMPVAVNTCINNRNLGELAGMRDMLNQKGVLKWQFQIARPMGNFLKHQDLVLEPSRVDELLDFAYETTQQGRIQIHLGDDIGYYSAKQDAINSAISGGKPVGQWTGCHAGKRVIGVRANGDIIGCLSIRDNRYIEGNVRKIPLKELWTRPGAFAWNRDLTKKDLKGFCSSCQHGAVCLGGCAGVKLTMTGSMEENKYCHYRNSIIKQSRDIESLDNYDDLMRYGETSVSQKSYQMADLYFQRALELKPQDARAIDFLGFVNFFLENYEISKGYNEKALELNPANAYAHKGLGLCLSRLGKLQEGILEITKAIEMSGDNNLDYYMDLVAVLDENRRTKEAFKILKQVRKTSPDFKKKSEGVYNFLVKKLG
ncbi:MAG: radical SAM protein [Spirochaetales bacterium]|nr:radical SAM protein [Spirochaetales bacterium]